MDKIDLYERAMQNKREANVALLKVAAQLAPCTSEADWRQALQGLRATSLNDNWVNMLVDGILVQLHVNTMCLMADKGGGDVGVARYLLDYRNHTRACRAVQQIRDKGEL